MRWRTNIFTTIPRWSLLKAFTCRRMVTFRLRTHRLWERCRPLRNGASGPEDSPVPKDLTRADYRASWAKMVALLGRMHRAGIPIVAGTDGSGIEIVRELEIYTDAGYTPAEALATATIIPARLLGVDKQTGSIKVGKAA